LEFTNPRFSHERLSNLLTDLFGEIMSIHGKLYESTSWKEKKKTVKASWIADWSSSVSL
jgi:hypothetical protein